MMPRAVLARAELLAPRLAEALQVGERFEHVHGKSAVRRRAPEEHLQLRRRDALRAGHGLRIAEDGETSAAHLLSTCVVQHGPRSCPNGPHPLR